MILLLSSETYFPFGFNTKSTDESSDGVSTRVFPMYEYFFNNCHSPGGLVLDKEEDLVQADKAIKEAIAT
jgi:hypothetical protein